MKKLSLIMVSGVLCVALLGIFQAPAYPETVRYISELVWSADVGADHPFRETCALNGAKIGADGSAEYLRAPGTCELSAPYAADGLILSLEANWTFTGKVILEVSVTGAAGDYAVVTNGVPYVYNSKFGSRIKWRATLADGSALKEVRIAYKDIIGTAGSWGNPGLSGFGFKKRVFINGSKPGDLFNYQVPVKVGEASAGNCDLTLKGVIMADFRDVYFTQADARTRLPYYLESVSGAEPKKRAALFWVKIPQIPVDGLPIYIYYNKPQAEDLSNGKETFDFFEDYSAEGPDPEAWQAYDFKRGTVEYKLKAEDGIKALDASALTGDEIADFFKKSEDFAWVRARSSISPAPSVNKEKTAAFPEEAANLAVFSQVTVSPNGDLVLSDGAAGGEYTSASILAPFKARIMVPEYNAVIAKGGSASADISANAGQDFKTNCVSEKYYYASRKDFSAGDTLKWRLRLSRADTAAMSGKVKEFSLDFRPGFILSVSPAGKERLAAGDTYAVGWSAQEYEPSYTMGIAYSLDGGKNYSVITEDALNTGKYSWTVPRESGEEALLKVYDKLDPDINAVSDGYFSIAGNAGGTPEGTAEEAGPGVSGQEAAKEGVVQPPAEAAGAQEKAKADKQAPEESAGPAGKQLYELLVMTRDNTASSPQQDRGSYKRGDIVTVMPAGHNWSESEKNGFFITRAYLTPEEAARLLQPKVIIRGVDKNGSPAQEAAARRRFRVNLDKQGMIQYKGGLPRELSADRPMLKTEALEDKDIEK